MALQNLRSSTANKRPVATSLSDGQIAINTNAASPGIFFKNSSNVLTKVGPIQIGTSAPNSSPAGSAGNAVGEQWLDTSGSTVVLKVWDGSAWQQQNKFSAVAGTAAAPSYSFSGDPNTGIYSPGADQVAVATNGVGRLFVDASGNVGVGTTSPSDFLHVMESSASAATPSAGSVALFERAANAGITIATGNTGLSTLFFADSDSPSIGRIVYDHSSDSLQIYTNGSSERARIDSSGRLLVGTSTSRIVEDWVGNGPQGLIQVEAANSAGIMSIISAGTIDAQRCGTLSLGRHRNATVGGTPTVVQSGDALGAICFAGGDGTDMRTKGASIRCEVDGTPGTNDMPGRLVFSTTADGASSPTERMRIDNLGTKFNYGTDNHVFFSNTGKGSNTSDSIFYGRYSATGTTNGTICVIIRSNGQIENINGVYGTFSDLKLKENITDAQSQWDDIKKLKVVNYNYRPETNYDQHTQLGVIAQDVEQISPGLVSESADRDKDGNDLGTVTKSVKYSVLYMKAVKALQEAMERIETLEGMVAVNNITIDEQQHQLSTLAARLTALESA